MPYQMMPNDEIIIMRAAWFRHEILFLTRSACLLCRGCAPIRDGLLAAAVEHLLSIDVEIRWEDIVEAPTGEA